MFYSNSTYVGNRKLKYSNSNSNCNSKSKSSGASYKKLYSDGGYDFYAVNAWRLTSYGLVTASCFPLAKKDETPVVHIGDKYGNPFCKYVVKLKQGINVQTYFCLMRLDTRKIVISDLGLVISPNGSGKTANGKNVTGYFGRNYKK